MVKFLEIIVISSVMFGEKVIELIKEADRNRETIDQYNVSLLN